MIRPLLAALLLLVLLSPSPSLARRPAPRSVLSEIGYGPLRIGMSWDEAREALPGLHGEYDRGCFEAESDAVPGLFAMFEDDRLTSVSTGATSDIPTSRGVRVGDSEGLVRSRYGRALVQTRHEYEAPPAKYLTLWVLPRRRGIRFEIDSRRRVSAIHAGGASITYSEGCS
jgi:hypothetical protein